MDQAAEVTDKPAEVAEPAAEVPHPGRRPDDPDMIVRTPLVNDRAELRRRWLEIQSVFVDDPRGSVTEAARFAAEVISTLTAAAHERERMLRGSWDNGTADTEMLRNALRHYRTFLDRLTAV